MANACDENALLRYCLSLLTDDEADEVRNHLAECRSCVAYLSAFSTSPTDPPAPRNGKPTNVVDELRALPETDWPRFVAARRTDLETLAGVQALIHACEETFERDPARGETLSRILVECADALAPSFASGTLQALAWTRRATALLRTGRLRDALAAISSAQERTGNTPAADYERALIAFTATDVLRELGRTDEALDQIRTAAGVFRRYDDARREASAREMEAAVLYRRGDYREAAAIFEELLRDPVAADRIVFGRLAANAAHSFAAAQEYEKALPLFAEAERIFVNVGYHAYVARIAWGKARVIHSTGDLDGAITALRNVFHRFEELRSDAEWIRVGLELVEWLLPTGTYEEARALSAAIHERAIEAGMTLQALEAVSFLREAALSERLAPEHARYVRTFIEDLPQSPEARFIPPTVL